MPICFHQAHPYFYTSRTQSLLGEDGRVNAQFAPEPDDHDQSSDGGKLSTGQLVGIVIGSAVAFVAMMMVVIGVVMWVSQRRKRRATPDNETVVLIKKQWIVCVVCELRAGSL